MSPFIVERIRVERNEFEIANRRVIGVFGIGLRTLGCDPEGNAPVVIDKPLGRYAPACNRGFVPVLLGGVRIHLFDSAAGIARISCSTLAQYLAASRQAQHVIDETAFGGRKTDQPNSKSVVREWNIDHAGNVEAVVTFAHALDGGVREGFEIGRVGLVGDDTQGAGL